MSRRDRWNARYAGKELVWSVGPNQLLEAQLADTPPGTALDAACGEGRNALWLAEQGWEVTAVDFSDVAIDKARQIAEKRGVRVNWQVLDLALEPVPDNRYDLVCILYFHTDPEERALWLPKLVEAVAPGGTFLYIGHDPSNIEHGLGGPQDPDLLPDVQSLVASLTGFHICTARIAERPVEADPGHGRDSAGIALDTFVRAVRKV